MFLSDAFDHALPPDVDQVLVRILGDTLPPDGDGGRHRVGACGRFAGHLTGDLLGLVAHPKSSGALVVAEEESERVLYVQEGLVVGAASNVLFERLGRVLYQAGVVTHADADSLIGVEEGHGDASLAEWLPEDVLTWGARRRAEAVAAALPYIRRGHFVLVEGKPALEGLATVLLDPRTLATEAMRIYDAWRHGSAEEEQAPPVDAPEPLPGPLEPRTTREEEVEDIFRRIREADLGFK